MTSISNIDVNQQYIKCLKSNKYEKHRNTQAGPRVVVNIKNTTAELNNLNFYQLNIKNTQSNVPRPTISSGCNLLIFVYFQTFSIV